MTFHLSRKDAEKLFGESFAQEIAQEVRSFTGSYISVRATFLNGDEESPIFSGVFEAPEDFRGGGYEWSYHLADDWLAG